MAGSVIRQTGQAWKLAISFAAMLAGSVLPVFESLGMSWTVGSVIAIAGYGFGLAAIRCPECNDRWFWSALMKAEWYLPLMTKPACPACQYDFSR